MDRRDLLASLGAFAVCALVREARASAPAMDRRLSARRWIDRQNQLAAALSSGVLSGAAWHDAVTDLARSVDVTQLLAEIRGARSSDAGPPFMHDPVKRSIRFLDDAGAPRRLAYAAATFAFGPENVITPHAHLHMASAHMVVEGRVRIRTFDRVGEAGNAVVIRPTGDHIAEPGMAAAMTTARDNVHWFAPASARAMTFDVIVDGLDAGEPNYVIQPLDPLSGARRDDGTVVAPILSFTESMQRFPAGV